MCNTDAAAGALEAAGGLILLLELRKWFSVDREAVRVWACVGVGEVHNSSTRFHQYQWPWDNRAGHAVTARNLSKYHVFALVVNSSP